MWLYLVLILAFGTVFSFAIILASKNGSKAAQLESLKAELRKIAEEQAKAEQINDSVASMSADEARKKLAEIASKSAKVILLGSLFLCGCASVTPMSSQTVCNNVHFDYADNFNNHNSKEMVKFYCFCVDRSLCE